MGREQDQVQMKEGFFLFFFFLFPFFFCFMKGEFERNDPKKIQQPPQKETKEEGVGSCESALQSKSCNQTNKNAPRTSSPGTDGRSDGEIKRVRFMGGDQTKGRPAIFLKPFVQVATNSFTLEGEISHILAFRLIDSPCLEPTRLRGISLASTKRSTTPTKTTFQRQWKTPTLLAPTA